MSSTASSGPGKPSSSSGLRSPRISWSPFVLWGMLLRQGLFNSTLELGLTLLMLPSTPATSKQQRGRQRGSSQKEGG